MAKCPFLREYDNNNLQNCITTTCQIWDSDNNQCGMKVSSTILDSTQSSDTLMVLLKDIIGDRVNTDNGDGLLVHLQNILGKKAERDDSGLSSIVTYFQDILGKKEEKYNFETLLKLFIHVHNQHSHILEHECSNGYAALPEGLGLSFKDDILQHIHDSHYHQIFHYVEEKSLIGTYSPLPPASLLMQEFATGEDIDNNGLVFGKDFAIDITSSNVPKTVINMTENPTWDHTSYPLKTWAEYIETIENI